MPSSWPPVMTPPAATGSWSMSWSASWCAARSSRGRPTPRLLMGCDRSVSIARCVRACEACPRSARGWPAPSRCSAAQRSRVWRPGWRSWTTRWRSEPPTTSPRRRSCSRGYRSCSNTRWCGQRSTGSSGWASVCSGTAARLHCSWPQAPSPIGWPCICLRRGREVTLRLWTCSGWRLERLASVARRMWPRRTSDAHWQSHRTQPCRPS